MHSLTNDSDKINYITGSIGRSVRMSALVIISVFLFVLPAVADNKNDNNAAQGAGNSNTQFSKKNFVQQLSTTLASGSVDQAIALFDKIPVSAQSSPDMQVLKASLLFSAGKDSDAASLAQAVLQNDPKNVDALSLNMMLAKKSGDKLKKSAMIKQIIAIDPKNADANIELAGEQALSHRYAAARDYYRTALLSDPQNENALFGYGQMSYYLEKDDDAKSSFEKMLQVDPNSAIAYAYLGKLESETHGYQKAKEYINKAIALEPNNTDFYLDLGTYNRFLGKYEEAENAWKKAVENDPAYFLGYAYLAGIYDEQDKFDDALAAYRKVVETNPKYYYAYESLGMFAWHSGSWAESRAAFSKAREQNQDNISYVLMIAATYLKEKNTVACKEFTAEVMKKQDHSTLEYLMVRLYHDQSGDLGVVNKVQDETNRTKRGKMLYYLALYFDLIGKPDLAQKYYAEVVEMKSPMFFEYRLAEWSSKPE